MSAEPRHDYPHRLPFTHGAARQSSTHAGRADDERTIAGRSGQDDCSPFARSKLLTAIGICPRAATTSCPETASFVTEGDDGLSADVPDRRSARRGLARLRARYPN